MRYEVDPELLSRFSAIVKGYVNNVTDTIDVAQREIIAVSEASVDASVKGAAADVLAVLESILDLVNELDADTVSVIDKQYTRYTTDRPNMRI